MYAPGAARSATAQGEWRRWASQLATVFATLGELPAVRYSASDGGVTDAAAVAGLARECHAAVQALARRSTGMPAAETCELLVLGRAFDPVAACTRYGIPCDRSSKGQIDRITGVRDRIRRALLK